MCWRQRYDRRIGHLEGKTLITRLVGLPLVRLQLLFSIYPEPPMCRSALRLQSDHQEYNDANLVLLQPLPVADATAENHVTVLPPAEPLTEVSPLIPHNHAIAPSTDGSRAYSRFLNASR